jgi:hypothetical protein
LANFLLSALLLQKAALECGGKDMQSKMHDGRNATVFGRIAKSKLAVGGLIASVSALVLFTGHRLTSAAAVQKAAFNGGSSCMSKYNDALAGAKAALIKGDRSSALASLLDAKRQLATCEERDRDSSSGRIAVSLNFEPDGPERTL